MTDDDIRTIVIEELRNLTPETDPAEIGGGEDFRDALDFDSMDVLNLVIALGTRLGVRIPESDYPQITTLDGAVGYLAGRLGRTGAGVSG